MDWKLVRGWAYRICLVGAATGLAGWLLWVYGAVTHVTWLAIAAVAATGGAIALVSWTMPEPPGRLTAVMVTAAHQVEAVPPPALDYRLIRLRSDVRDTVERDDRPDAMHRLIHLLTADRLMANHGVDLVADWPAALHLLHPDLASYLADPPTTHHRQDARRLEAVVGRIEEL